MELTYDWCNFQSTFALRRSPASAKIAPVYAIVEEGKILLVHSADCAGWAGESLERLRQHLKSLPEPRSLVAIERAQADEWMQKSIDLPHFLDQVHFLREKAGIEEKDIHFLLQAIHGWWAKVLPVAYGILIRLQSGEGTEGRDFFILIRQGKLESFHAPDLAFFEDERWQQAGEVVKYLSEKHSVPVQAIVCSEQEWRAWQGSSSPWKDIAFSIRENSAKLVPFRWRSTLLLAGRAFLKI